MKNDNRLVEAVEIDTQKLNIKFTSFFDTQFYNHFESFLIQWQLLSPQEDLQLRKIYIFQKIVSEQKKIQQIVQKLENFNTIQEIQIKEANSNSQYDCSLLIDDKEQLKIQDQSMKDLICQILKFEGQLESPVYYKKFKIIEQKQKQFMKLDYTVLNSLSIFQDNKQKQDQSIFKFFNQFVSTRMGSRVLKKWLMQPQIEIEEIQYRIKSVKMYLQNKDFVIQMKNFLKIVPDLDLLLLRLIRFSQKLNSKASLKDCYSIYLFLKSLKTLMNFLKKYASTQTEKYLLDVIQDIYKDLYQLEEFLQQSIDLKRVEIEKEIFVNPNFSEELQQVNIKLKKSENQIITLKLELESKFQTNITLNKDLKQGTVFETSKEDNYQNIKNSPKFKIISIKKKKINFSFQELDFLNQEINQLKQQYYNKQKQIEEEIILQVCNYNSGLELLNYILIEQDIFLAFSQAYNNPKNENNFCFPNFNNEKQFLDIKKSWHLCLDDCISNDISMERNQTEFILITGPNMGGKSTFIRQIAINILLAHIGAPVPAQSCSLSLFTGIFTRTGANDDQTEGRSTFMNEMVETSNMLDQIDENSFVIIDELGRGTSVFEGLGLSQSITEYIIEEKKSFCLFATHFQELTFLDQKYKIFHNYHLKVIEEKDEVIFCYKVVQGKADRSYGIEIIKCLQFPNRVIQYAENILKKFES